MLGDGLLALFEGREIEAAAGAAFQAARDVQRHTRALNARRADRDPITVNMGLNAGLALVGFTRLRGRSGERWVYGVRGPVTNIAARLSALATRGQILATRSLVDVLPPDYSWRPLGPQRLENVSAPVEVVELLPDRPPAESSHETTGRILTDG